MGQEIKRVLSLYRIHFVLMYITLLLFLYSCTTIPPTDEKTLSIFMLNYITDKLKSQGDFLKAEDYPNRESLPIAYLIVWSPIHPEKVGSEKSMDLISSLVTNNAKKVWLYKDGKLIEQDDKQKAIEEYRAKYIASDAQPSLGPSMFGYYEYGITSKSDREAKIYFISSWGSRSGVGVLLTLQLKDDGQWELSESEMKWIS